MPVVDELELQTWLASSGYMGGEREVKAASPGPKRFRRIAIRAEEAECPCGKPHLELVDLEAEGRSPSCAN